MQKITIVAHALSAGGGISIGKNLILSLQQQLSDVEYQLFIPADLEYERSIVNPQVTEVHSYKKQKNLLARLQYDFFYLERAIAEFKPDVLLCMGNRGVGYQGGKQFLLCHDAHLFYPVKFYKRETFKKKLVKYLQQHRLAKDLRKTEILFVQTDVAAKRICEMFSYHGEVVTLPNAVSVAVQAVPVPTGIPDLIKQQPEKFKFFYLTRYYPHKNIELLIELFDKYRQQLKGVCLYLTVEENHHPMARQLLADIKERKLDNYIINLGALEQTELSAYFCHVDALLMPTTLESFSGTYLEAMSFSCPILTSNLDFAKAICGDAALYFDPWSVDSLFQAVDKLINSTGLQAELRNKGAQRLHSFGTTWEENGARLVSAILGNGN